MSPAEPMDKRDRSAKGPGRRPQPRALRVPRPARGASAPATAWTGAARPSAGRLLLDRARREPARELGLQRQEQQQGRERGQRAGRHHLSPLGGVLAEEGVELGAHGPIGYYCLDPSQEDSMFAECNGAEKARVGDGQCNPQFNTAACNFDGGDCCEETCDDDFGFYPCGSGQQSYACIDPRFKVSLLYKFTCCTS